jgi:hypothetical protein
VQLSQLPVAARARQHGALTTKLMPPNRTFSGLARSGRPVWSIYEGGEQRNFVSR